MILAIDIGNTNIVLGALEGENVIFTERVATDTLKTELQYIVELRAMLELYNIDKDSFDGGIISSVVPQINRTIINAISKYFGFNPLLVGPGVKNGLKIQMDNPAQVGSDLIVNAVAGAKYYGAPLIMIDMGTATTISLLDKDCVYAGGMIIPGVRVSLDSLVSRTSQLPKIALEAPKKVIGKNTIDCMKSGLIIGQASLIDGMIDRIWEELGYETKIVATGGLSKSIIPNCKHKIELDDDLILKGLAIIYAKNKQTV